MTDERLEAIRARQMPDVGKRRLADHVVRTGLSRYVAQAAIRRIIRTIRHAAPNHARRRRIR
jgi:hypothetical protein